MGLETNSQLRQPFAFPIAVFSILNMFIAHVEAKNDLDGAQLAHSNAQILGRRHIEDIEVLALLMWDVPPKFHAHQEVPCKW